MSAYCPICDDGAVSIFRTDRLPAEMHRLRRSREEAVGARRGPIDLHRCLSCGHAFNTLFDEGLVAYDAGYSNPLQHGRAFQLYARGLAARLAAGLGREGPIVEVGCGDGWFTDRLADAAERDAVGLDAAARTPERRGRVRMASMDEEQGVLGSASLLVSRHVLEHMADPAAWLGERVARLGEGASVYLETPAAESLADAGGPWDVVYEHAHVFSVASLAAVAWRAGVRVDAAGRAFGGQFAFVEGVRAPGAGLGVTARAVEARPLDAAIARWQARLAGVRSAVVWGAGTKGMAFLNLVGDAAGVVSAVIDVNPGKQGCFVPGTGHEILAPDAVAELRPELVIVANGLYRDEVAGTLARLGCGAPLEALVSARG